VAVSESHHHQTTAGQGEDNKETRGTRPGAREQHEREGGGKGKGRQDFKWV